MARVEPLQLTDALQIEEYVPLVIRELIVSYIRPRSCKWCMAYMKNPELYESMKISNFCMWCSRQFSCPWCNLCASRACISEFYLPAFTGIKLISEFNTK